MNTVKKWTSSSAQYLFLVVNSKAQPNLFQTSSFSCCECSVWWCIRVDIAKINTDPHSLPNPTAHFMLNRIYFKKVSYFKGIAQLNVIFESIMKSWYLRFCHLHCCYWNCIIPARPVQLRPTTRLQHVLNRVLIPAACESLTDSLGCPFRLRIWSFKMNAERKSEDYCMPIM